MDHLQQLLGPRGAPATPRRDDAVPDDGDWATRLVVAESYQPEQASTWDTAPTPTAPRVTLAVSTDLKQWNYRYMFEKKGERSLELDTRLSDMGDVLRQAFGLTTDWDDPSIPNQASIYTVGRICARVDPGDTDADAPASTRLTPTNLMLETSRMVGNGQRVPLVLDAKCVVRYAWADETAPTSSVVGLFPGMIVGLRGRNGSGHRFVAEELLMVRNATDAAARPTAPRDQRPGAFGAPERRDQAERRAAAARRRERAVYRADGPRVPAVARAVLAPRGHAPGRRGVGTYAR